MKQILGFLFLLLSLTAILGAQTGEQPAAVGESTTSQAVLDLGTEPLMSVASEEPFFLAAEDQLSQCTFPPPMPSFDCVCGTCCECGVCRVYPGGYGEFCGFEN